MNIDIKNKIRIRFGVYFSIRKLEKRSGVCSQSYKTDKHICLWDFDESDYSLVILELNRLMRQFRLPDIYVFKSSPGHYHAYSFTARLFREVINILSATKCIDIMYLRLGMARGYYTLRFSPKAGNKVELITVIESKYPEEMPKNEVTINEYFTTNTA